MDILHYTAVRYVYFEDKVSVMSKSEEASGVLRAVLDLGSTSIRMVVAQSTGPNSYELLDSLTQSVAIGHDTFVQGEISNTTTEACVDVLRNFSVVLQEYGVSLQNVVGVATSAVREASNGQEFLDRIFLATGFSLSAIDRTEVNRLTYLAIRPLLNAYPECFEGRVLACEIGGGSSELLGLNSGEIFFAQSYHVGAYRLRELLDCDSSQSKEREILSVEVENSVRRWQADMGGHSRKKSTLLLLGAEARFIASQLDKDWDEELCIIRPAPFKKLAKRLLEMSLEQIMSRYHLAFEEAQTLAPALEVYLQMLTQFGVKRLIVCRASLRDGLLTSVFCENAWDRGFIAQIEHSVDGIMNHYQMDVKHAETVCHYSMELYDALKAEHRLGNHYRVILAVAAKLHDVGRVVNNTAHHKHSQYIIANSTIFGLSKLDMEMIAMIARYHRKALPRETHQDYSRLPRSKRLIVKQLAAILRVADALDCSRADKAKSLELSFGKEQFVIQMKTASCMAEKRALLSKGKLFKQVYGRDAVLKMRDS